MGSNCWLTLHTRSHERIIMLRFPMKVGRLTGGLHDSVWHGGVVLQKRAWQLKSTMMAIDREIATIGHMIIGCL